MSENFRERLQALKEIDISTQDGLRDEMINKANGKRTIPQIFFNDFHVKPEFLVFHYDLLNKNENVAETNCVMFNFDGDPAGF